MPQAKGFDFFQEFSSAFDLFSRFSKVQPVPGLGHIDSTKEEVEGFYDFWYNFDSWRSFEWLDKEVNEGSDRCATSQCYDCDLTADEMSFSRDDKRYTEKKNKTERARRKKEDIAKVRSLVDLALRYACVGFISPFDSPLVPSASILASSASSSKRRKHAKLSAVVLSQVDLRVKVRKSRRRPRRSASRRKPSSERKPKRSDNTYLV